MSKLTPRLAKLSTSPWVKTYFYIVKVNKKKASEFSDTLIMWIIILNPALKPNYDGGSTIVIVRFNPNATAHIHDGFLNNG